MPYQRRRHESCIGTFGAEGPGGFGPREASAGRMDGVNCRSLWGKPPGVR